MEDAAEALKLAFSVFAFVLALGIAFTTFNQSKDVSDIIIASNDRTYIEAYEEADITNTNGRIVGAETVIPNLYRYYKEKYAIEIANDTGTIKELFDLETESKYSYNPKGNYKGTDLKNLYPTGVNWIGSKTNVDAKTRVDYYITNTKNQKINGDVTKHTTNFNFDKIYYQTFEEIQTGNMWSYTDPTNEDYDGTYFLTDKGSTKMVINLQEK